jgi:hypothetical protein
MMHFKTYKEAGDYYIGNLSATNNMHGEEDNKMENWVMEQNIDERTVEEDLFELRSIIKRQGREWVASEVVKHATQDEIDFADRMREKV